MGYTINCVERTDNRDFASQPSSPVLEPEKNKEVKELPVPTQGDSSVDDYCSIFHIYLVASGKVEDGKIGDAEVGESKEKFIRGLSPKYKALCEPGLSFESLIDRLINYEKEQKLVGPEYCSSARSSDLQLG